MCTKPTFPVVIVLLLSLAAGAAAALIEETFDTDLGKFDIALGNTDPYNNYSFSNTNNAGGAGAGELGGTFARHGSFSYVADGNLGGAKTRHTAIAVRIAFYR